MAIELFWDDTEQTVMLAEFNGKWTWDELHALLKTIKRLSKERERVFGAIIDLRQGLSLPNGSVFNREGLAQFRRLLSIGDGDKKGPVVVVGMNSIVRSVFDAISAFDQSAVSEVTFADSLDDARTKIYRAVALLNQRADSA